MGAKRPLIAPVVMMFLGLIGLVGLWRGWIAISSSTLWGGAGAWVQAVVNLAAVFQIAHDARGANKLFLASACLLTVATLFHGLAPFDIVLTSVVWWGYVAYQAWWKKRDIEVSEEEAPRTKRRVKPATVNRELACLKALFNHVLKGDVPLRNPVSRVKFCEEHNEQTRVLNYEEQERYLAVATPMLRDVATLMLETGMRPEDVYRIRRENVQLEQGYLVIPYGKTKAARRRVPLTAVARRVLGLRMASADAYLLPARRTAAVPFRRSTTLTTGPCETARLRRSAFTISGTHGRRGLRCPALTL